MVTYIHWKNSNQSCAPSSTLPSNNSNLGLRGLTFFSIGRNLTAFVASFYFSGREYVGLVCVLQCLFSNTEVFTLPITQKGLLTLLSESMYGNQSLCSVLLLPGIIVQDSCSHCFLLLDRWPYRSFGCRLTYPEAQSG